MKRKIFPEYEVTTAPSGAGQFTTGVQALVRTEGEDGKWYSQVVSLSYRGVGAIECEREAVRLFVHDAVNTMVLGIPNHKIVDNSGHEIYTADKDQQSEKARLIELLPKAKEE